MTKKETATAIAKKRSYRDHGPKGDVSSSRLARGNPFFGLQQSIGNQAMLRLLHSGVIQAKVRDNQPGDKPSDGSDCSGWESDPESFSVLVAKQYLGKGWKPGFSVGVVKVIEPPPHWQTRVIVHTGAKDEADIVLTIGLAAKGKIVLVGRGELFDCSFDYHCTASGQLVLKNFDCP